MSSKDRFSRQSRSTGFTLLELMTAIAVLGVLLAIGVPSFNEVIRTNRTVAQTNELVTALAIARSEASKRGMPISICAALDQTTCAPATTANWANGWIIFTDATTPGVIDAPADILQRSRPVTNGIQLSTASIGLVRFGTNGARISDTGTQNIAFGIQPSPCTAQNRRQVSINLVGRSNLSKQNCL